MSAAPARELAAAREAPRSPFKFLDAYGQDDEPILGGREDDVFAVSALIVTAPLAVLYGRSGLGKTSLLLAGVFPELRRRGFLPVHVRLLGTPLGDLARAVGAASPAALLPRLRALTAERPCVLALDQFEELFLRFPGEEQARLAAVLGEILADEQVRARILLVVREDYLGRLGDLGGVVSGMARNAHRLEGLSSYGVRQSVVRPIALAGVAYEETFVNRVVDELARCGNEPDVLQILCDEAFREAQRSHGGCLTGDSLRAIGGADGAYQRYLDHVISSVPEDHQFAVRVLLASLMTSERTKRAMRYKELAAELGAGRSGALAPVLTSLVEARLIRSFQGPGGTWFELRHERLVGVIDRWLSSDPLFEAFRFARSFVRQMARAPGDGGARQQLISIEQIKAYLDPCGPDLPLEEREAELVFRSALAGDAGIVRRWAERLDRVRPGAAAEVVDHLLSDPDAEVRARAARGAPETPDRGRRLVERCRTAALEDCTEGVRRAAGQSLAALARDEDLEPEVLGLRDLQSRQRGLELLADIAGSGRRLSGLTVRDRRAARRIVRDRVFAARRDQIRARALAGLFAAIVGGVAATLLIWMPAALLERAWTNVQLGTEAQSALELTRTAGLTLFVSICMALLIGWAAAVDAAKATLSRRKPREALGLWRGSLLLVMAALLVLLSLLAESTSRRWMTVVAPGLVLAAAYVLRGSIAVWARRCVGPETPWARGAGHALLWPSMCAVVTACAIWTVLAAVAPPQLATELFLLGAMCAFLALVSSVAAEWARYRVPLATARLPPPGRARALTLLAILVTAVAAWRVFDSHLPVWPFSARWRVGNVDAAPEPVAGWAEGRPIYGVFASPGGGPLAVEVLPGDGTTFTAAVNGAGSQCRGCSQMLFVGDGRAAALGLSGDPAFSAPAAAGSHSGAPPRVRAWAVPLRGPGTSEAEAIAIAGAKREPPFEASLARWALVRLRVRDGITRLAVALPHGPEVAGVAVAPVLVRDAETGKRLEAVGIELRLGGRAVARGDSPELNLDKLQVPIDGLFDCAWAPASGSPIEFTIAPTTTATGMGKKEVQLEIVLAVSAFEEKPPLCRGGE